MRQRHLAPLIEALDRKATLIGFSTGGGEVACDIAGTARRASPGRG